MTGVAGVAGRLLVLLDEGAVDVDQHPLLPLGDRRVGQHGHLDAGGRMIVGIEDSGPYVEGLSRDPEGFRQLLQHFG